MSNIDLFQTGAMPRKDLVFARNPAWPDWFASQADEMPIPYKKPFDPDMHRMNVGPLENNFLKFQNFSSMLDFVMTKIGPVPRKYFISKLLDYAEDDLEFSERLSLQDSLFQWRAEHKELMKDILSPEWKSSRGDLARRMEVTFAGRELSYLLTNYEFSDIPLVADGHRVMMDFWYEAKQAFPDVHGFRESGRYYAPEQLVLSNGRKIDPAPPSKVPNLGPNPE